MVIYDILIANQGARTIALRIALARAAEMLLSSLRGFVGDASIPPQDVLFGWEDSINARKRLRRLLLTRNVLGCSPMLLALLQLRGVLRKLQSCANQPCDRYRAVQNQPAID